MNVLQSMSLDAILKGEDIYEKKQREKFYSLRHQYLNWKEKQEQAKKAWKKRSMSLGEMPGLGGALGVQ